MKVCKDVKQTICFPPGMRSASPSKRAPSAILNRNQMGGDIDT